MTIHKSKSYDALRHYLARKKIEYPSKIAHLLFDKFVLIDKPTNPQYISSDCVKDAKLYPGVKYNNFTTWRNYMKENNIIYCIASSKEQKIQGANHNCNLFKVCNNLKKYIEAALNEQMGIHERLDRKVDYEEFSLAKMETKLEQEKMKGKIADLELKIEDLDGRFVDFMLYVMPPDNLERRLIVKNNTSNKEECVRQLIENNTSNKEECVRQLIENTNKIKDIVN